MFHVRSLSGVDRGVLSGVPKGSEARKGGGGPKVLRRNSKKEKTQVESIVESPSPEFWASVGIKHFSDFSRVLSSVPVFSQLSREISLAFLTSSRLLPGASFRVWCQSGLRNLLIPRLYTGSHQAFCHPPGYPIAIPPVSLLYFSEV